MQWIIPPIDSTFQEVTVLASFGIPYQNIGSLEALYLTLCKSNLISKEISESQGFDCFVNWATQAEIKQGIGRLRAHNRTQEQLCFYFCADYDLSFLEQEVECVNAADITIEAGSLDEKSWWKIKQSVKELWETGQKVTQSTVSAVSGISQGYISKLPSKFGGSWKEWLKIFLSLLESDNSDRNNLESESCSLKEEVPKVGRNVTPFLIDDKSHVGLLSQICSWYKNLDKQYWGWILETTSLKVQARIITALLLILPKPWHQEFFGQITGV